MTETDLKKYLEIPQSNKLTKEDQEFDNCLRECQRQMLEKKARLGLDVITDDEDGIPRRQRAIDVYERVFGDLPPLYSK